MDLRVDKAPTRLGAPVGSPHRSPRGLFRPGALFHVASRAAGPDCRASAVDAVGDLQGFHSRAPPRKNRPTAARAKQHSARWRASTVRAVSLHAVIVLASLVAASVTLVASGR